MKNNPEISNISNGQKSYFISNKPFFKFKVCAISQINRSNYKSQTNYTRNKPQIVENSTFWVH